MGRAKKKAAGCPGGYDFLTTASRLGVELRAAFYVLMYLPETRGELASWLLERAVHADPAVGLYLDMASENLWDDYETRREILKVLDRHHPTLGRCRVDSTTLVLRTPKGYWASWGFTDEPRAARRFYDTGECYQALRECEGQGLKVTPEFLSIEAIRRDFPEPARGRPGTPEGVLREARTVPGCSWVPIPPERRKKLEVELLLKCWIRGDEDRLFPEVLKLAAMFGHPLYTVYADLSVRQEWDPVLREELARVDLTCARYRDPPGDVPELQPMAGPYRVVCSREGFWGGSHWTAKLDEAEKFPSWNHNYDDAFESSRRNARESSGLPTTDAYISAHLVEPVPQNSPLAVVSRKAKRPSR